MIAHLRGRLLSKSPNAVIVDCGGVGYDVAISVTTFSSLPDEGAEVSLHINTQVREDAIALFGFTDRDEKRLFERLITVSGIGPKLGITVLSGLSAERLVSAIRAGDTAMLVKIPGIGKKTAERVVLELKDKLDDLQAAAPAQASGFKGGPVVDDVLSALVNLGYKRDSAQRAVETAIAKHESSELTIRTDFDALFRYAMQAIR
ncbi:Holliday junction branch migration protein RuvA [Terriglobus sp. TAA 43]|uniref:Holliday junction branch migration protein RuvA n=1 Tax=Terriglobus sp. TAA 43 TaxID=278961 RepID=UPI000646E877|nr:Holliday junction branch migration protein RuvA [Terriglobus sp. TAA 43]